MWIQIQVSILFAQDRVYGSRAMGTNIVTNNPWTSESLEVWRKVSLISPAT